MTTDTAISSAPTLAPDGTGVSGNGRGESDASAQRVAGRLGLEYVDLRQFRINTDLFRRIPFDVMLRYGFLPQ
jgi:hypothetical protein